jgi:NAD(P)-dependent dehydrogenase (short-subunit alcohol dehydrogenase family)
MTDPHVILVTGGANGIGAALVRRFTVGGHHVVAADIDAHAGTELAEQTGCHYIETDVAELAANRAAVAETVARFGRLDTVCLNAGAPIRRTLGDDFDAEHYRRGMSINLDGIVYGANAALPHLPAGRGAVLITASLAGITASPDLYYATSKHALIGFTRSLALLLQPDGITVNVMCPGFVGTRLVTAHRNALAGHGLAIAEPSHVANAAVAILDSGETGRAWDVQAGRPTAFIDFPDVTIAMIKRPPHHS